MVIDRCGMNAHIVVMVWGTAFMAAHGVQGQQLLDSCIVEVAFW
jgi:hypothetical protein